MSYKVQTNRVKAFLIQDLSLILGTLLVTASSAFMSYVHITQAGESCGRRGIAQTCSPVWAYVLFGPLAILGVLLFIKLIYNLFKIGTVSTLYLKYRNFSGNPESINQTINAVAPTEAERKITEFPYGKFMKMNVYFMLIASLVLAFLPLPSWVHIVVILLIPLCANIFSLKFLNLSRNLAAFRHASRRNKQLAQSDQADQKGQDYLELQADIAKSSLKMLAILILMIVIATILSGLSVGINEAIYMQ